MGWLDWFNDSSGGETSSKTEKNSNRSKDTHYIRTKDNSHVMIRENSDGSKTAHGFHGISKK